MEADGAYVKIFARGPLRTTPLEGSAADSRSQPPPNDAAALNSEGQLSELRPVRQQAGPNAQKLGTGRRGAQENKEGQTDTW